MREIRFRGKRLRDGSWVYGYLISGEYSYIVSKEDLCSAVVSMADKTGMSHMSTMCYAVDPCTVGQYVDRIKAYEGDVLWKSEDDEDCDVISSWRGVVKYNKQKSRIMIFGVLGEWHEVDDFKFKSIQGNAHDDPELFTGEYKKAKAIKEILKRK